MGHGGLEGVVAATTRISDVDGAAGRLTLAGFAVEELAPRATYEQALHLLWTGELQLDVDPHELGRRREVPGVVVDVLRYGAARGAGAMDLLRAGLAAIPSTGDDHEDGLRVVGAAPAIAATALRLLDGAEPIAPDPAAGTAADLLRMLGIAPEPARVRALDTYLVTVSDHGLNASTFTARVVISTGSDVISAVTAAVGALKGPLHGGAPGPALELVREIGRADRAEAVLRDKLAQGERLMGFGHRVYKVRDPRAEVLGAAAERLYAEAGDRSLFDLARDVESVAIRLLDEHKPGRQLRTNVEFYTALLLDGVGLRPHQFTPAFAVGRIAGWTAHALEQRREGRLIRPSSVYEGPRGRRWPAER